MSVFVFNSRVVSLFADTHTHTDKYTHIFYFRLPVVWSGECQTFPPRPSKFKNPKNKRVKPMQHVNRLMHTHTHTTHIITLGWDEYRLLLRQDNADMRLREKGYNVGLISEETYAKFIHKKQAIQEELERLRNVYVGTTEEVQKILADNNSTPLRSGIALSELIKRPELNYNDFAHVDKDRPNILPEIVEQIQIELKYEGYISRQQKQVEQFKKLEKRKLPVDINYEDVYSLRLEAKQKLEQVRPVSIGQASRISGVSPADISVLLVYLEQKRYKDATT